MISDEQPPRFTVDHDSLPRLFPTHRHSPEFWEHLGRTIATFGFLEDVLGKGIFAYTATRQCPEDELQAAYEAWIPRLKLALRASGSNLVEMYGKEVRSYPESTTEDITGLIELGFIDYVQRARRRGGDLFPDLRPETHVKGG